jgi:hypothetical protein
LTPFDVDPENIEKLKGAFTTVVNDVLASEAARAGLAGTNRGVQN